MYPFSPKHLYKLWKIFFEVFQGPFSHHYVTLLHLIQDPSAQKLLTVESVSVGDINCLRGCEWLPLQTFSFSLHFYVLKIKLNVTLAGVVVFDY